MHSRDRTAWKRFDDRYCVGNTYTPAEATLCRLSCLSCSSVECRSACEYYNFRADDKASAVCSPEASCLELCAADAACTGVDVVEWTDRQQTAVCYFNKDQASSTSCNDQVLEERLGGPHQDYTFVYLYSPANHSISA